MVSEFGALSERFKQLDVGTVLDVKFFLRNTDDATPDVIFDEVGRMLTGRELGNTQALSFDDATLRKD